MAAPPQRYASQSAPGSNTRAIASGAMNQFLEGRTVNRNCRLRLGLPLSVLVWGGILVGAAPARAECPVTDFGPEAIRQAIASADSCQTAIAISRACAYGSSFDQQTAGIAGDRCLAEIEPLFPGDRATLNRLQRACTEKYADQQGTMFLSFAAFCRLEVIEGFHDALTPFDDSDFGD